MRMIRARAIDEGEKRTRRTLCSHGEGMDEVHECKRKTNERIAKGMKKTEKKKTKSSFVFRVVGCSDTIRY